MIRNLKICCYNRFTPNINFFLKVHNKGNLFIQVILQYSIDGGTVTRTSGIMEPGAKTRIAFQNIATNICFNIINESLTDRPLIYHGSIPIIKTTCYEITGTTENPMCINVPC